jgi:hypothetical protein
MAWSIYRICGKAFAGLLRDLSVVYLIPLPLFVAAAWLTAEHSWWRFGASLLAAVAGLAAYAAVFFRQFKDFFSRRRASRG